MAAAVAPRPCRRPPSTLPAQAGLRSSRMKVARFDQAAVRLKDGRVLVSAVQTPPVRPSPAPRSTTRRPATGRLRAACARRATATPDGAQQRLVLAPAARRTCQTGSSEIYDPATGSWSPTGWMIGARRYHRPRPWRTARSSSSAVMAAIPPLIWPQPRCSPRRRAIRRRRFTRSRRLESSTHAAARSLGHVHESRAATAPSHRPRRRPNRRRSGSRAYSPSRTNRRTATSP